MSKLTILLTGATDGLGLETARRLISEGHRLLLHGRNQAKVENTKNALSALVDAGQLETYVADLSRFDQVETLASSVAKDHQQLDVLLNNAGVFHTPEPITHDGLDVRFVVNALAPYLLTRRLWPLLGSSGRVINLSSAAQAPVDLEALTGGLRLSPMSAYAQSKLALTMWSRSLALEAGDAGPSIVAVNPGSMLGTKMVKEGFGVHGRDRGIGAEILMRAALSDGFASASGEYFDNDAGRFAPPHPDALDSQKCRRLILAMDDLLARFAS